MDSVWKLTKIMSSGDTRENRRNKILQGQEMLDQSERCQNGRGGEGSNFPGFRMNVKRGTWYKRNNWDIKRTAEEPRIDG
jgi:hypothetical protein